MSEIQYYEDPRRPRSSHVRWRRQLMMYDARKAAEIICWRSGTAFEPCRDRPFRVCGLAPRVEVPTWRHVPDHADARASGGRVVVPPLSICPRRSPLSGGCTRVSLLQRARVPPLLRGVVRAGGLISPPGSRGLAAPDGPLVGWRGCRPCRPGGARVLTRPSRPRRP